MKLATAIWILIQLPQRPALAYYGGWRPRCGACREQARQLAELSPREREVSERVARGVLNKQIREAALS
jgi:DNA-binding NarL/FixJ family response regulator